ncbi:recombinase family protein [Streptomyces sp. C10-9-1]|uniref:recombinase family protein n=1 Tax=Streptomyces sp. C10-9-1 TaxID=1859285 RepID=UPI0035AB959D
MKTPTLALRTVAFLYARISEDPRDRRRGINRQMSDLRTFSQENTWETGGEYVENDVSAHSGEDHPEDDRLMSDAIEAAREPERAGGPGAGPVPGRHAAVVAGGEAHRPCGPADEQPAARRLPTRG